MLYFVLFFVTEVFVMRNLHTVFYPEMFSNVWVNEMLDVNNRKAKNYKNE